MLSCREIERGGVLIRGFGDQAKSLRLGLTGGIYAAQGGIYTCRKYHNKAKATVQQESSRLPLTRQPASDDITDSTRYFCLASL